MDTIFKGVLRAQTKDFTYIVMEWMEREYLGHGWYRLSKDPKALTVVIEGHRWFA